MRPLAQVAIVAALAAGPVHAGDRPPRPRFPVGVTVRTFTKTSVTTGAPRPLETTVWYPAVRATGTPEAQGLRDATVRRGRWPLVVFSHGACGSPTAASYFMRALAADGFVAAAPPHPGHTRLTAPPAAGPGSGRHVPEPRPRRPLRDRLDAGARPRSGSAFAHRLRPTRSA
jgi:predicted dienelactone hydrolase